VVRALLLPLALCAASFAVAPAVAATPPDTGAPAASPDAVFARGLRLYHAALLARRLGQSELRREELAARVAEAEEHAATGRVDEAIARLAELVEHPQFDLFADTDDGRAALYRLGDALATAGVFDPARGYLRRVLEAKDAWAGYGAASIWARRAVGRLVDIALEGGEYDAVARDLASVPPSAPEEVRGEIAYMSGRAAEAADSPSAALASYALVTQRSRFWAQATYLSGLIEVERGQLKRAEELLCKVADPKRSAATTPVFADAKFFVVRDLARLGLGRIAHEQGRNDDARYYYYLVPQDSDRLAEALYEAATTRYEKKDYEGAHDLLEELASLGVHNRYEDEAWVLGAWVDLARCRFADADRKLTEFLKRYEPVRDAARRLSESDAATRRLLSAAHTGSDAAGAEIGGVDPNVVRTVAALLRVDPAYGGVVRQRAVLERQASGLVVAMAAIGDMSLALATNGGLRPAVALATEEGRIRREARDGLDGLEHQIADLESSHAQAAEVSDLRRRLLELRAREVRGSGASFDARAEPTAASAGADLPDLLRGDAVAVAGLERRIEASRRALGDAELALARDALRRLDLRVSRLLRRARLGRIESVLGRKRALEVEVEAIRLGFLPQDAVDSLDAAQYLEDNQEYWPFEGDNWPDEVVGTELK
jgi:tetratricopeptide (TPR) repeat protein